MTAIGPQTNCTVVQTSKISKVTLGFDKGTLTSFRFDNTNSTQTFGRNSSSLFDYTLEQSEKLVGLYGYYNNQTINSIGLILSKANCTTTYYLKDQQQTTSVAKQKTPSKRIVIISISVVIGGFALLLIGLFMLVFKIQDKKTKELCYEV